MRPFTTARRKFRFNRRKTLWWVLSLGGVGILALWTLGPLLWLFITSIKPSGTEFRIPVEYWPPLPTAGNYATVLGPRFHLLGALGNSLLVSAGAMGLTLLWGTLAAYALVRIPFRGKKNLLAFLQLAGMIPPIVVLAPTFLIVKDLGLLRTLWAMILPNAVYGLPLASFLVAAHFSAIPREMEEAALLEGASHWTILVRIFLPLIFPGLISAGILVFMGSWGEYMLASTVSPGNPGVPTLPVAIMGMTRAFTLEWTWIAAGSIISIVPVILLALIFQKFIARGLTLGILK